MNPPSSTQQARNTTILRVGGATLLRASAAAVSAFIATLLLPIATWSPHGGNLQALDRLTNELWSRDVPFLGLLLGGITTFLVSVIGACCGLLWQWLSAAYSYVVVWAISFGTSFIGVILAFYCLSLRDTAFIAPAVWLAIIVVVYCVVSALPLSAGAATHPRCRFLLGAVLSLVASGVFVYACRKA